MNWYIFERRKQKEMPEPKFEDNWKQEYYERNVREGTLALTTGKNINIYDDGRGYELALEIKRQFILEYQKQLSEKIQIESSVNIITVKFRRE